MVRIGSKIKQRLAGGVLGAVEDDEIGRPAGLEEAAVELADARGVAGGEAEGDLGRHLAWVQRLAPLLRPFLNTVAQGAWPTLMGATWPDAEPNMYFGPSGIGQVKGPAKTVQGNAKSQDPELARKLWEVSEELTNVRYLS